MQFICDNAINCRHLFRRKPMKWFILFIFENIHFRLYLNLFSVEWKFETVNCLNFAINRDSNTFMRWNILKWTIPTATHINFLKNVKLFTVYLFVIFFILFRWWKEEKNKCVPLCDIFFIICDMRFFSLLFFFSSHQLWIVLVLCWSAWFVHCHDPFMFVVSLEMLSSHINALLSNGSDTVMKWNYQLRNVLSVLNTLIKLDLKLIAYIKHIGIYIYESLMKLCRKRHNCRSSIDYYYSFIWIIAQLMIARLFYRLKIYRSLIMWVREKKGGACIFCYQFNDFIYSYVANYKTEKDFFCLVFWKIENYLVVW